MLRSGSLSPYPGENQSYISTASSHDLTTHHPANASFDPLMMPGGVGAVGKFNKGKLNTYLYSLNRRLEEENKTLLERIAVLEKATPPTSDEFLVVTPQLVNEGRRTSTVFGKRQGANTLGDVAEEGWLEEKLEFEAQIEKLKSDILLSNTAMGAIELRLEEETHAKLREKERWKERMVEVENGVEKIVGDLEHQLRDAERRVLEREGTIEGERARALKAEKLLEENNELGGELKRSNERGSQLSVELAHTNTQVEGLADELERAGRRVEQLQAEVSAQDGIVRQLEGERHSLELELEEANTAHQQAHDDLQKANQYLIEMEEEAELTAERIQQLEETIAASQVTIQEMGEAEIESTENIQRLRDDIERGGDLAAQMQEALDIAQKQAQDDEEVVYQLKFKITTLERENHRLLERSSSLSLRASENVPPVGPTDADIEALEDELDAANREIARLNALLSQSPARKAMEHAKDTRIEMLEKEKEELAERIKTLKFSTPSKIINASGISPAHRQVLAMSLRTPKTPGAPLRDLTWLNTTIDPSVSPLIDEVARLQKELDRANESIDDKLDELEEAGLGVVGLTKKLEDAYARMRSLEEEIARLSRREERRVRRLERTRCQKCNIKVDVRGITDLIDGDESSSFFNPADENLPSEPPTPPTRSSEGLRSELKNVNSLLSALKKQWQEEKQGLLGEKMMLQDATNRLATQNLDAKEELKKHVQNQRVQENVTTGIQSELDVARSAIAELEENLKAERAQLRAMSNTQDRIRNEKEDISNKLQRTEVDMDEVKGNLRRLKQDNQALETELRDHSYAEQKTRLLQARLSENAETIKDLRHERSLLATDHKNLQQRFAEVTERATSAQADHATWQANHDNHRHQLDLHLAEIADLKRALAEQAKGVRRAEREKDRLVTEKSDFVKMISELQADLKRVRKQAEIFGQDLKVLRKEKEHLQSDRREEASKADRARKQTQTQIRLLNEQLTLQKENVAQARADVKTSTAEAQLGALNLRHNKECKGLSLQIGYLKAKFIREALLRNNLVWQKNYLLILLDGFERSEKTICAAIAKIGFPISPLKPRRRSFKAVVHCMIFLSRARCASHAWQKERAVRVSIHEALKEVRQRRVKVAA